MKPNPIMSALFIYIFSLSIAIASHLRVENTDYFKALEKITKPTPSQVPVLACNINEKKDVLELLKKNGIKEFENLKLLDNGRIYSQSHEEIEIYKGNFSNEGIIEYMLISQGGTMPYNGVTVYKRIGEHLIHADLDKVIINNLIPGGDMSRFYMNVARPFAITQDGKTYLRFMGYPAGRSYDKTELVLCTYIWKGKKFNLVGPNWRVSKTGHLIEAKDCIGSNNFIHDKF